MRNRRHKNAVRVAAVAAVAPLLVSVAPLAHAAPADVTCDGVLSSQRVADVTVPDGAFCRIENSVVTGGIELGANANLQVFGSTVRGWVRPTRQEPGYASSGSYLNAWNSQFQGNVYLSHPWGAWLADSRFKDLTVQGCYRRPCTAVNHVNSQVYISKVTVTGDAEIDYSRAVVEDSTVRGQLVFTDPVIRDEHSSALVQRSTAGTLHLSTDAVVCSSTVRALTAVHRQGNTYSPTLPVSLGAPDGCGGNRLNELKVYAYPTGELSMTGNRVNGLASSTPAPVGMDPNGPKADVILSGTGNRFTGGTQGAFVEFAGRSGNSTASVSATQSRSRFQESTAKSRSVKKQLEVRSQQVAAQARARGPVR